MILLKDQNTEEYKNSNSEDKDFIKQIKIIDFGLAEYVNSKKYIYTHVGTPGYVAPEIL